MKEQTVATHMVSARIEGELVTVKEGTTILEAARAHGKSIPTLCHLEGLTPAGACRLCMVELAGTQRLLPACTTVLQEGMSIRTTSANLTLYRRMAVELLLVERNHTCAVCASNGACELQGLARSLGVTHVRYSYRNPPLRVDMSHPRFVLDPNRCILCTRCVRVCAEIEGANVWEVASRGITSHIVSDLSAEWGSAESCTGCGKCVQVCPTGALTEKGKLPFDMHKDSAFIARLSQRKPHRDVHKGSDQAAPGCDAIGAAGCEPLGQDGKPSLAGWAFRFALRRSVLPGQGQGLTLMVTVAVLGV